MPTDAYTQFAEQEDSAPDVDHVPTELILSDVEKAYNIVWPVIHSGTMPRHNREPINKGARLLCLTAGPLSKGLRKAMEFLTEDELEQVEHEINKTNIPNPNKPAEMKTYLANVTSIGAIQRSSDNTFSRSDLAPDRAAFIARLRATSVVDEDAKTGSEKPMRLIREYALKADLMRRACGWKTMDTFLTLAEQQIAEARRCIGGRL